MLNFLKSLLAPFDPLDFGEVVGKHELRAAASYMPTSKWVGKTVVTGQTREPGVDSFILDVRGVTRHGFHVTREIYVSGEDFGYYRLGDTWHRK